MEHISSFEKTNIFFFQVGKKVGIEKLSCLFENTLMAFTTFMQKYKIKDNFLQYYSPVGMENYAKAKMFSTTNWIRPICNRKARMQNSLQYFTQSTALPSSNCREKTHWIWLYLSIKFCTRWKRNSNQIVLIAMALIKRHSIYLWNVQLLNRFGINLQSGTTPHVEETLLWSKTELYMVF